MKKDKKRDSWFENVRSSVLLTIVFLYSLLWISGLTSHLLFGGVSADQSWLGSLFLFLAGMIVFITVRSRREFLMFAGFALFGFGAEVSGVHFGFPFGAYSYTDTLGLKFFEVPVVMAFAWVAVISYVREILLPFDLPRWLEALAAALCVTAIDLIIDPLAVNVLGYWSWVQTGAYFNIPLTNFGGWFLTGFLAFLIFQRKSKPNVWHFGLGLSIILFFTLLAVFYKIFSIALIGCVLCLPGLLLKVMRTRDIGKR